MGKKFATSSNRVFPFTAKDQPTLWDMPSVTMFAGVTDVIDQKQISSKHRTSPKGTGTSGTLGTLGESVY